MQARDRKPENTYFEVDVGIEVDDVVAKVVTLAVVDAVVVVGKVKD